MPEKQVVIVGAGLAGLACALRLQECGIPSRIFEKSDGIGGRVQTHLVDGFRLDLGFQVLLTAYPRTQELVDFKALELKSFYSGAQVRFRGAFHTLGDPIRRPVDSIATLLAPVGSLGDKLRMLRVRKQVTAGDLGDVLARPEITCLQKLHEYGFSEAMIQRFFRPFLGGIFLEPDLVTSSRKFEFVMRMFSKGEAALPKLGMEAIPNQMAKRLNKNVLQCGCGVKAIDGNGLTLEGGEKIAADIVVVATTETEADLLQRKTAKVKSASVNCLYYSAAVSPVRGPWLVLNGDGKGPINNLCVPSELHGSYAPEGKSLVSVTTLGPTNDEIRLEREVRAQLVEWYGEAAQLWEHLRTYVIPEALTLQEPPALESVKKPIKLSERLFVCGDYLSITSIEGAISSGIRCADAIFGG